MNTGRIRKATEKETVEAMARYALTAETGIEDAETRQVILAKAAQSLIFNDGDVLDLRNYLRALAFAEDAS